MESTQIYNQSISNVQNLRGSQPREMLPYEVNKDNLLSKKFCGERCEDFLIYLDWLGLTNHQHLTVLSKSHHYYFEPEDLKSTETIVSLKLLNNYEKVKDFLSCVIQIMPVKSYFIGSFFDRSSRMDYYIDFDNYKYQTDEKAGTRNSLNKSRIAFLNMIFNIMDLRRNRSITKKSVLSHLETGGMKVLDMTELNGLVYFCAQKVRIAV